MRVVMSHGGCGGDVDGDALVMGMTMVKVTVGANGLSRKNSLL